MLGASATLHNFVQLPARVKQLEKLRAQKSVIEKDVNTWMFHLCFGGFVFLFQRRNITVF